MTVKKKPAPGRGLRFLNTRASERPQSLAGNVKDEKREGVGNRMDEENDADATDEQLQDWLHDFAQRYPVNFYITASRPGQDLTKMSAPELLEAANRKFYEQFEANRKKIEPK